MDDCGEGGFGVPEFLIGSHKNRSVGAAQLWAVRDEGDLAQLPSRKYVVKRGDMIVWNGRTIHRILGHPKEHWAASKQRRAMNGSVARAGAKYVESEDLREFMNLGGHSLEA